MTKQRGVPRPVARAEALPFTLALILVSLAPAVVPVGWVAAGERTLAGCGDGATDPGEDCDDGGESASCDVDCTFMECGDDLVNLTAGEVCDDGNHEDGDSCAADCSIGCSTNEAAKLVAPDATANDAFGSSVAIDGEWTVIGAPLANSVANEGSVYLFGRNAGGPGSWGLAKKLVKTNLTPSSRVGYSVSISGDSIVAGALFDNSGGIEAGAVYVFERGAGGLDNWGQVQKLVGSQGIRLGVSVSVSGNTLVAGGPYYPGGFNQAIGLVRVYERNSGGPGNWGTATTLTGAALGDEFGGSVSISGDTVVVGARGHDNPAFGCGAAYVYERNAGGTWGLIKKLTASNASVGDGFGVVSIHGHTIVVGAPTFGVPGTPSGTVYVFERDAGGPDNWGEIAQLLPADVSPNEADEFGGSVSIHGDALVVGAASDDDAGSNAGAVYVFERNAGGPNHWGQIEKLTAADAAAGDQYGVRVTTDGFAVVVGATGDDDGGTASGSAYVMEGTCLDGIDCTDADADGSCVTTDCDESDAGIHAAPLEVEGVIVQIGSPTTILFETQDDTSGTSTTYQVVTGELGELLAGGSYASAVCLGTFPDTPASDPLAGPAHGEGRYYLVRAQNGCGTGTYGDSTVVPDPRDALGTGGICP